MKQIIRILIFCSLLFTNGIYAQNDESCCLVNRGNVDNSPDDVVDISDLLFFVDYMFLTPPGPAPECFDEADIDASGAVDVSDLLYLVDYMFVAGATPPPSCPLASNLAFNDEFIGPAGQSPDAGKWDYDIGTDWGNAQLEYDTDRTANVSLDGNGNLAIIAREESYMGQPYTSARIVTRDLFEPTYGRVEARIKLPTGQGIWPAFWLLGADIETVGWPQCGEIDIMEYLGHDPYTVYGTAHGPGYSGGGGIGHSVTVPGERFDTAFHVFAIEWSENEIRWFLDDSNYYSITPDSLNGNEWVFDHPFYIILNVAVGGNWPGAPDGTTVFPQTMLVDYVRVYADTTVSTAPVLSAPEPTENPLDVISVFSDTYTNVTVDTWSADWDEADVEDYTIGSDNLKKYSNLVYAGIEFVSQTIDATAMTHLHIDVWTPDPTAAPSEVNIKLVDFGANGVWDGGGDDVEHEISIGENIMNTREWVSIDLPLASFTGLTTTAHLAQLLISGDPSTLYVDNIYFYNSGLPTEPTISAPVPSFASSDVISLYSELYPDVTVDTWSAGWDEADVQDVVVASDIMKKYTNLVYAGIEFTSSTIDASSMTHFYINIWTPDITSGANAFKVKLVDFGANGVWDGGGDDVEHEIRFDEYIITTGNWITLDLPLSDFTNLVTTEHMAQLILSGDISTVYVDNVLFHK